MSLPLALANKFSKLQNRNEIFDEIEKNFNNALEAFSECNKKLQDTNSMDNEIRKLTEIGEKAFSRCEELKTITFSTQCGYACKFIRCKVMEI